MQKRDLQPTLIFIFGGSGDLTQRKLIPALYNLYIDKYLPSKFHIVSIGRSEFTPAAYKTHIKKGVETFSRRKTDLKDDWNKFCNHVEYHLMDLESEKTYKAIGGEIKKWEEEWDAKATVIFTCR
jgi:glucose-6-phosphate 1-dehydrogenase